MKTALSYHYSKGFTLLELMIGLLIGLITTLAVTIVMVDSEGIRRRITQGSDAQVNAAMAISALQRNLMHAGYGFMQTPKIINCPIDARYGGSAYDKLPANLLPVVIEQPSTPADASNTIRIFASGKTSFSIPVKLTGDYVGGAASFPVSSSLGAQAQDSAAKYPGDLILAGRPARCQLFRVTSIPGATAIGRADDAWNPAGFPEGHLKDDVLINLGVPVDVKLSVDLSKKALVMQSLVIDPTTGAPSYETHELAPNIVRLKAFYGKDTDATPDGQINEWSSTAPTDNAGWLGVLAIRVALVARSGQYEKEAVTTSAPVWDVGTAVPMASDVTTTTCDGSECLSLKVDDIDDWQHYRYKVLETIVPLRNVVWRNPT